MSQADILGAIRALIDSQSTDVPFSPPDLHRFNVLTDAGALAAVRTVNPSYPGDKRHVRIRTVAGGPFVAFSWRNSVRRVTPRQRLLQACRSAVSDQMQGWLFEQARRRVCVNCRATRQLTVDHVGVPFVLIVLEWIGEADPNTVLRERTTAERNTGQGALLLPSAWRSWRAHHDLVARYQVMCLSCNARKGARPAPADGSASVACHV